MSSNRNLESKKIVCLGGGIGTSNLIRGLKRYKPQLTVITSMADDGGSSGRLRKAYNIMPPGDLISCIAALISDENQELASLLTYRFPGTSRENKAIDGHKLGNLLMLAEILRTKNIYKALDAVKKMFGVTADILPATDERTHLSATTVDGRRIHTETTLDLALYAEPRGLKKVFIRPKNPRVSTKVIESIKSADVIISGPGDLYTNQLPVLIIPKIKQGILESKAKKFLVLNVANKPFETKGFTLKSFVDAIIEHLGVFPFDTIIANNNHSLQIPKKYNYSYIQVDKTFDDLGFRLIKGDVVSKDFPIYHDAEKLASIIAQKV